jgi:hypothetical protein
VDYNIEGGRDENKRAHFREPFSQPIRRNHRWGQSVFCPHDQEKRERPKFYALQVVSEKNIQNAKGSLGAPDGRCAEILPGGQLVLIMEKEFWFFPATGGSPETGLSWADSGSVVGKGGADIGLEVWSPCWDTEGIYHYAWMPVGLSTTGFILPERIRTSDPLLRSMDGLRREVDVFTS